MFFFFVSNVLFSSMINAQTTQIVGLGFIVCLARYPFKAEDVLDQLEQIHFNWWYVCKNLDFKLGQWYDGFSNWADVAFCLGWQNSSLPFNKYAFLTTHNAFAIEDEPSHTGIPRVTTANQEDTITQQLNVCLFPPSMLKIAWIFK